MAGIGRRLYQANFGAATLVTEGEVRAVIDLATAEVGEHTFSPHFLWTEWSRVVDAWQLESWEDYRDVMRLGRKTRLAESQRALLWSIFAKVRDGLDERGLLTEPRLFRRVERHIAEGAHPPFEFCVIDEAQDIDVSELRFLAALGGGRPNSLFFAGDLGQRIFRTPFSWHALGVDVRGRSHTLRINYRTSHQIRRQVDRLLPPELADVDGIAERRGGTVSAFNGPEPDIRVLASPDEEASAIADWLTELRQEGFAPHEIALFVRSEGEIARAEAAVHLADQNSMVLHERSDGESDRVVIGTMHLAKGLEFRAVAVVACDDEILAPAIAHRERGRRSRPGGHLQHGTAPALRGLHARPRSSSGDWRRARVRVPRRSADGSVNSSTRQWARRQPRSSPRQNRKNARQRGAVHLTVDNHPRTVRQRDLHPPRRRPGARGTIRRWHQLQSEGWERTRQFGGSIVLDELTEVAILHTIQKFRELGRDGFFGHHGVRQRAKSSFIRYEGQLYDLKAIARVALGVPQGPFPHRDRVREAVEGLDFEVIVVRQSESSVLRRKGRGELPRQSDPDRKAEIEKAAIAYVVEDYQRKGFTCTSVEADNKGWDLECTRGRTRLLVEVKGCSGTAAQVELTPNEYRSMRCRKKQYRLAVVTSALDDPGLSIVRFKNEAWRDRHGREVELEERTGARVTMNGDAP